LWSKPKFKTDVQGSLLNNKHIRLKCIRQSTLSTKTLASQTSASSSKRAGMNLKDSQQTKLESDIDLMIYKYIKAGKSKSVSAEYKDRKDSILKWRKQLKYLQELPLLKQRTQEWYDARKTRLTASDLEEAISEGNLRLAKKKAGVTVDTTNYISIPPLKWGTMFEAMAIRCYSQERQDMPVHEFGLLPDPVLEHFGASPDGITDLGIMVEIKCPYSREIIDNSIPYKYYMQIQGQLAVCCLQECDYIECDFKIYDNVFVYVDDIFNNYADTNTSHGIIAEYKNKKTEEYFYLYSEPYLTAAAAHENIKKQMTGVTDNDLLFMKFNPWRLRHINVQRVTFNPALWSETVPKINAFWDKVEQCKTLPKEEAVQKSKKIVFIEEDDD
jgi:putative phage-type endonuclease